MSTYEEKKEMRDKGMSCREIAEVLGISRQAVYAGLVDEYSGDWFRPLSERKCIFPRLREWMNANRVTMAGLARRGVHGENRAVYHRITRVLRGESKMMKADIDFILAATGLTYEEAFGE